METACSSRRSRSLLSRRISTFLFHVHCTPVVDYSKRIFTENDISDRRKEQEVLCYAVKLIQQAIETHGVTLDELTEIVLNLVNVGNSLRWHYYFVDHTHRLLFWVQSVGMWDLNIDLQGSIEYSHISMFDAPLLSSTDSHVGYMVEAHYWYASPPSLSGMSVPVAFLFGSDPNSSISHMTWNRGRIVNTTPTIVSFQNEPSKILEACSIMQRLVPPFLKYLHRALIDPLDMVTNDSPSSPFAQDELVATLDVVNSLKGTSSCPVPFLDLADFQ